MDERTIQTPQERRIDPARVLALSDGLFAIILTLLVLDIQVPDLAQGQSLVEAVREIKPSFVAFLISFAVVAIAWAGHRGLFGFIRSTDRPLIWLNFLYLLPLCLLPFGASLLAQDERGLVGLRLYGLLLLAIDLTRLMIWVYATGRPTLLVAPIEQRARRVGIVMAIVGAIAYALAIAIAAALPTASLLMYAVIPALYFVGVAVNWDSERANRGTA